jgi:hypothetical protein
VAVEFSNKNTKVISDATMINLDNAQGILDQLRDFYRQRYKQGILLFSSDVDLGTAVLTSTIQSKQIIGTVLRREISLTGGNLSKIEVLGSEYEEPS